MNIKTSLLEDYVNSDDTTTKQNKFFKINTFLFTTNMFCFLFFFHFYIPK